MNNTRIITERVWVGNRGPYTAITHPLDNNYIIVVRSLFSDPEAYHRDNFVISFDDPAKVEEEKANIQWYALDDQKRTILFHAGKVKKIAAIKWLRELCPGMSLTQAKRLIETPPLGSVYM